MGSYRQKVKMTPKPSETISNFSVLWDWAQGIFKSLGSMEARLKRTMDKNKSALQWWLIKTVVMSLSVFMSLGFLILGLLFLAMDYGGVPRGVVFTSGGLAGLLFLGFWFQQQNKKHGE